MILALLFSLTVAHAGVTGDVIQHTKSTVKDSVDRRGLWILGGGALATVVAHQFDHDIRHAWGEHQRMSRTSTKIGEWWGSGIGAVLVLGPQLYFDKENSVPGIEGVILGNLSVQVLKYSVKRERPDQSEKVSFPSGHTQSSFSIATSLTMSYGWQKALPLWGLAVFTGLTRISDDQHWLSDVVAGATLGVLFGRAGFKHHVMPTALFESGRLDGVLVVFRAYL